MTHDGLKKLFINQKLGSPKVIFTLAIRKGIVIGYKTFFLVSKFIYRTFDLLSGGTFLIVNSSFLALTIGAPIF